MKNFFGIVGKMAAVKGLSGLVEIVTKGRRSNTYCDELPVTFADEALAQQAAKSKYVRLGGRLVNHDNGDTYGLVQAVAKSS